MQHKLAAVIIVHEPNIITTLWPVSLCILVPKTYPERYRMVLEIWLLYSFVLGQNSKPLALLSLSLAARPFPLSNFLNYSCVILISSPGSNLLRRSRRRRALPLKSDLMMRITMQRALSSGRAANRAMSSLLILDQWRRLRTNRTRYRISSSELEKTHEIGNKTGEANFNKLLTDLYFYIFSILEKEIKLFLHQWLNIPIF